MKRSTKLILGAFLLFCVTIWFPQLFGKIRWDSDKNKAADFISGIWARSNKTLKLMNHMSQDIKYIKFTNGSEFNEVTFIASDSIKVYNPYPENFSMSIVQDTLLVSLVPNVYKQTSYYWIRPDVQLLFETCNASVNMRKTKKETSYATQKPILVRQNSHLQFFAGKDSTTLHSDLNLGIEASGKSFIILYDFVINQLDVQLDNSQLSYGYVQINQINAQTKGKSLLNSILKNKEKNKIGQTNITSIN